MGGGGDGDGEGESDDCTGKDAIAGVKAEKEMIEVYVCRLCSCSRYYIGNRKLVLCRDTSPASMRA